MILSDVHDRYILDRNNRSDHACWSGRAPRFLRPAQVVQLQVRLLRARLKAGDAGIDSGSSLAQQLADRIAELDKLQENRQLYLKARLCTLITASHPTCFGERAPLLG